MKPPIKLEFHPLADLFPLMEGEAFKELADDIEANGQQYKIWLYEGKIIDGRNRYLACLDRDIDPQVETYKGKDPVGFVWSRNGVRRHLTPSQKAMAAARIATMRLGDNQHTKGGSAALQTLSRAEAAAKTGASERSVADAAKVIEQGIPELIKTVDDGTIPVSTAAPVSDLPKKEQKKVVAGGAPKIKEAAAATRKRKKREAVTKRPDQPIIPKTIPAPKAATKKCRPTDPDALFALESAEWCRDQLKEVGRRLDDLARGPFGAMVRDQHEWFEDPEPVFLHEKKAQDPDARRGVVDVYTCSALTCMELLFWNVARDLMEEHGAEEVEEEIEV